MALTYYRREDLNYGLNVTVYPGGNHSIDRVVDQVHSIAGDVNELQKVINKQVNFIGDKLSQSEDGFNAAFHNLSDGAHNIADIAVSKFDDFPVDGFFAILVLALIVIIVALLYFISAGTLLATQNRYKTTPDGLEVVEDGNTSSTRDSDV